MQIGRLTGRWYCGWKIVRVDCCGKLFSATHKGHPVVEYLIFGLVNPPKNCGPLAVFNFYINARLASFLFRPSKIRIYPCVYKKSDYSSLWSRSENQSTPPVGTDFADLVMLFPQKYDLREIKKIYHDF